jgi:hypothetical protein
MFCLESLCVGVVGVGWGVASTTSRNPPFKEYNVGWLICEPDTKNRIVSWTFSADHTMPIQMRNVEILQVVRIVMLKNCMIHTPYSNIQIWQDCIIQWLQRSAQVKRLGNQDTIASDHRLYSLIMMGQPHQQMFLRMLAKNKFQFCDGNKAIFETQEILRGPADVVDPAAASAMAKPEPVLPNPSIGQPYPPKGPNVGSARRRRDMKKFAEQQGNRSIWKSEVEHAKKKLLQAMRLGTDKDQLMMHRNKLVAMYQRLLMDENFSHFPIQTQELMIPGIEKESVKIVDKIIQDAGNSAMAENADNE